MKMSDLWKAIGDAPGKGLHALVDLENKAESTVVQAGVEFAQEHGVISQDTAQTIVHAEQVVQGVREGVADVVGGLAKAAIDPNGTGEDIGKGMVDAYQKGGGGLSGVLDAANVVNPLYHAAVAGYETYQAVERGDYKAAGKQGTHAAVDVAATAAIAVGGAELAGGDAAAEAATATEAAAGTATEAAADATASAGADATADAAASADVDAAADSATSTATDTAETAETAQAEQAEQAEQPQTEPEQEQQPEQEQEQQQPEEQQPEQEQEQQQQAEVEPEERAEEPEEAEDEFDDEYYDDPRPGRTKLHRTKGG